MTVINIPIFDRCGKSALSIAAIDVGHRDTGAFR
jgi:hypothetical protein